MDGSEQESEQSSELMAKRLLPTLRDLCLQAGGVIASQPRRGERKQPTALVPWATLWCLSEAEEGPPRRHMTATFNRTLESPP